VQRHSSPYSTACSQATSAHPGPLRLCPRVHFRHCVRRDDRLDAPSRQCHCRLFVAEKRRHREESRPCAWAFGRRADQQAERVVVRFQRKHVPYRPDADQDTTVTYRFWERTSQLSRKGIGIGRREASGIQLDTSQQVEMNCLSPRQARHACPRNLVHILRGVQFPDQFLPEHAWIRIDSMGRESFPEANTDTEIRSCRGRKGRRRM